MTGTFGVFVLTFPYLLLFHNSEGFQWLFLFPETLYLTDNTRDE